MGVCEEVDEEFDCICCSNAKPDIIGYHLDKIEKGIIGEASKITEEYQEFIDAVKQGNRVMEIIELSDLLGAISLYVQRYNLTLRDLETMSEVTKRAFINGARKN
jgi:phosphoribosyl-ATP pyrophosphohydrolase